MRPTRVRYLVLGVLCSLGFLTYLDRICMARVQDDLAVSLGFDTLDDDDLRRLQEGAANNYAFILTREDLRKLAKSGVLEDVIARRQAAEARLRVQKINDRMSWIFSAFIFGYMLFEVPGGWLGDRWGSRIVIFRIVLWWSLFTALTGSADTILGRLVQTPDLVLLLGSMVIVRFLFGAGEAGAYPNVGRALARWFPYRDRAFALGAIWMASRMGGAFAPLIIGWLMVTAGGWRGSFWVLGIVGAVWATLFFVWYRNRPEEQPGVNAAEVELIRGQVGAGTIYDDYHQGGLSWRKLFLSKNLWAIYITAAAVSFSWYINITFLPRYLSDRFEVDFKDSEWMTFMPLFVSAFTCLGGGVLSDALVRRLGRRWGRSLLGVVGFGLAGLCDLCILAVDNPWSAVALICAACTVQDLALAGLWAVGADIGGRYAGTVLGTMNMMGGVGAILSPLLTPRVQEYYGWDTAFLMFAGSYLLGALLWLRIDATEQIVAVTPPSPPCEGGDRGGVDAGEKSP